MKFKSILMSMLAVATLASCNKQNEGVPDLPDGNATQAYMSISIQMPTSADTKADEGPGSEPGTEAESKVKSVKVAGFDDVGNKLGVYDLSVANIAVASEAIKVAAGVKKIFVVVNPTAQTTAALNSVASFSALLSKIIDTETVTDLTVDNEFMMTSESGLKAVNVSTALTQDAVDIAAAIAAAKAAPAEVKVDRAVSKVNMTQVGMTVQGATATITGFMLNTTNKSYHPYSDLVTYATTSDPLLAKYRKDPNMDVLVMDKNGVGTAADAFNWLHNPDSYTWPALGTSQYSLENTMNVAAQNYNNTTKMLIKATYTPTVAGLAAGEGWFRVDGNVMTFAQMQAFYTANKDVVATKNAFDAFAVVFGFANFGAVVFSDLEKVANGGYIAAKQNPHMIEYFQKSVCYYDVNIKHDNKVGEGLLGRWGVVRNNFYTVNIEKILKPGLPFIPDPTDPDIKDPVNPDPADPKPNDDKDAYISVKIVVNPWTTWTQGVEL